MKQTFFFRPVLAVLLVLISFVPNGSLLAGNTLEKSAKVAEDQFEQGKILVKFSSDLGLDLLEGDSAQTRLQGARRLFSENNSQKRSANAILNNQWIESIEPFFKSAHREARSIRAQNTVSSLQDIEKSRINKLRQARKLAPLPAGQTITALSNIYQITLKADKIERTEDLVNLLSQQPFVEFVERVDLPTFGAAFVPNDPLYPDQWTHNNTAFNDGTPGADINTQEAWDTTTGTSTVIVAVLDSGVTPHSEFSARLLDGKAYYGDTTDKGKNDIANASSFPDGHGTQVAGIIGAEGDNAQGLAGICWNCKMIPIRVLDTSLSGTKANLALGIGDAVSMGADVINMSIAYTNGTAALQAAVQNAFAAGVTMVASRGNYNFSNPQFSSNVAATFPANYPEVISVGGLSPCDQRKSASSCDGENWFESMYADTLSILAPGTKVDTTSRNGGYVNNFNGTSASAPEVSGVVALMLSINPTLTPTQVRQILESTAIDLGPAGYDAEHGYGKVNAQAAVLAAQALLPAPTADLALSFTSAVTSSVTVNNSFSYNLTITNPSTNAVAFTTNMTRPTIAHTLGTISINGGADATGSCTVTATNVTCPTSVVASGSSTVVINITPTATGTASASFSITNPSVTDPSATNNTVSASTAVNPAPDPAPVVLSQWNFDESAWSGANAVADSVGTNHATAYSGGSPTTSAEVAVGSVAVLDGVDDYIKTPITFLSQGALSISAWYKTTNVGKDRMTVVGGNAGGRFEVYVHQGKPGCRVWKNGEKSIYATQQFVGDWHHVVCVQDYNAGQTRLYVDGVLRASTANASESGGGFWHIGKPGSGSGSWFQGMIDRVTMYQEALDDADVQTLYTQQNIYSPVAPSDTSLLGEWKFEESAWSAVAGQVLDSSPNNNHATAQGGVQSTALTGVQNKAANFDGVDDAILTPLSFSNANDLTISAWYKTDKAAQRRMTLLGGTAGGRFEMYVDNGKPGCRVWDTAERSIYATQSAVGVWTHVACVQRYGASPSTALYVNGTLVTSTPYASVSGGGYWYVGRPGSSAATYFNGTIDHPMIRARALNAGEILALYNSGLSDYPFETIDPAITAWYKFNDTVWSGNNGDVSDASGKNPGQTKNGVLQTVKLDTDKIASLDGVDDYISTPVAFASNAAVSMSAWVKTSNQTKSRMTVIGGNNGGRFEMYVHQGKPGCRVWTTKDVSIYADTPIDANWHHVTCVLDYAAGQTRLYVDGVLKKQVSGVSVSAGGSFLIGKPGSSVSTYYEGLIDNVRLYNKALNDAEASTLFAAG